MRLTLRLSVALISSVAAVSLLIAYLQTREETRDAVTDLDHHGLVLADSLTKSAEQLVGNHSYRDLQRLVDRFADREHIAGIAVYGGAGEILATTSGLLSAMGKQPDNMKQVLQSGTGEQESFVSPTGSMHLTALPLRGNGAVIGALALYYDATYIDRQAAAFVAPRSDRRSGTNVLDRLRDVARHSMGSRPSFATNGDQAPRTSDGWAPVGQPGIIWPSGVRTVDARGHAPGYQSHRGACGG